MNYCKECVLPDTRPGVILNAEGVCDACVSHREKAAVIDWAERKTLFEDVVAQIRSKSNRGYDCLIPVSGGKDSTYQVHMIKNVYKLHPLCVTWKTPSRTALGQKNLDNLINLGVDHIDFTINPETERKLVYKTLVKAGTPSLTSHMASFAVVTRCAVNFKIPLVVWGESTQMEYGGTASDRHNPYLDLDWIKKYGCCNGTTAEDWVDEDLTEKELLPYSFPRAEEISGAKIQSVFLGYYFNWDPTENFKIAKKLGFQECETGPKVGLYNFADLDCNFIIIHHYIKWYKFGMVRLFDNISTEIRNKRMTRAEGIEILKKTKVEPPLEEIKILCDFLKITMEHFWEIMERHRNKNIWKKDAKGNWYLPDYLKGL